MLAHFRITTLLLAFAAIGWAQTPEKDWAVVQAMAAAGKSLRVSTGTRTVSGKPENATSDSLTIRSGKKQQVFTRQEVTRVSVKNGHHGRNALIGLGAGAGVGAALGAASHRDCTGIGFSCVLAATRKEDTAAGALLLGIAGVIVGALIPAFWHDIYIQ